MILPRLSSLLIMLFALSVSAVVRAAPPTLSGRWAAGAMIVSWNIGDWGESCGPKPEARGAPAGQVTITQRGGELTISGAGAPYSTTQCWEQYPGLARVSHSGGARGWRTTCKTSAGDPRQATVVTTLTASDAYIRFDETGQYQFVVKGQNCTASVRRSRSFRLVQREGEAKPAPAASVPADKPLVETPAPPTGRCRTVGPPARLEVRPARKLMRPGETFQFRTRVLDAEGCTVTAAPTFRLESAASPASVSRSGEVRLKDTAPEGELTLIASVAGKSLRVVVEVASAARYAALLESERFTKEGESKEAAVSAIASSSLGTRAAVAQERARSRRTTFVAIVGAAALILGVLGLILVARSRKQSHAGASGAGDDRGTPPATSPIAGTICPTCREEYPADAQFCPLDGNRLAAIIPNTETRGPAGGVCPVCGQGFDPGVTSCPKHDEELVPVAVYRAPLAQTPETAKVCPICGTQYPGDGRFCGRDGAALVPMN